MCLLVRQNGLDFYVIMTLVPKIWEADLCHRDGAAQIGAPGPATLRGGDLISGWPMMRWIFRGGGGAQGHWRPWAGA